MDQQMFFGSLDSISLSHSWRVSFRIFPERGICLSIGFTLNFIPLDMRQIQRMSQKSVYILRYIHISQQTTLSTHSLFHLNHQNSICILLLYVLIRCGSWLLAIQIFFVALQSSLLLPGPRLLSILPWITICSWPCFSCFSHSSFLRLILKSISHISHASSLFIKVSVSVNASDPYSKAEKT